MEGLRNTLREKYIKPFQNFRGNAKKPGTRCSFEQFLAERPDGGEILMRNGKPVGSDYRKWAAEPANATALGMGIRPSNAPLTAMGELLVMAGIDPFQVTMNDLLTATTISNGWSPIHSGYRVARLYRRPRQARPVVEAVLSNGRSGHAGEPQAREAVVHGKASADGRRGANPRQQVGAPG